MSKRYQDAESGGVLEPLGDPAFFARAFIDAEAAAALPGQGH